MSCSEMMSPETPPICHHHTHTKTRRLYTSPTSPTSPTSHDSRAASRCAARQRTQQERMQVSHQPSAINPQPSALPISPDSHPTHPPDHVRGPRPCRIKKVKCDETKPLCSRLATPALPGRPSSGRCWALVGD